MAWIGGWNGCNQLIQVALCMWSIHFDDWFLGSTKLMFMQDTVLVGMKRDVHVMATLCDIDLTLFLCCSGWWQPGECSFMLLSGTMQSCVIPRTPPHLRILVTVDQDKPKLKTMSFTCTSTSTQLWSYERLLEISSDDFRACFAVFSSAGKPLANQVKPLLEIQRGAPKKQVGSCCCYAGKNLVKIHGTPIC